MLLIERHENAIRLRLRRSAATADKFLRGSSAQPTDDQHMSLHPSFESQFYRPYPSTSPNFPANFELALRHEQVTRVIAGDCSSTLLDELVWYKRIMRPQA